MRVLRTFTLLAIIAAFVTPALAGAYTAGGTFVVKTQFGTIVDNGGVICKGTSGQGIGGGCLKFPGPIAGRDNRANFVEVSDNSAGQHVAFQVCIDNNGDGICGGPNGQVGPCFDQIFFSHNDDGAFFNALGPLPFSFLEGCAANGGFPGYVVLLCQGAHEQGGASHTHTLTAGAMRLTTVGSGYGDFCGGGGEGGERGNVSAVAKAYVVE